MEEDSNMWGVIIDGTHVPIKKVTWIEITWLVPKSQKEYDKVSWPELVHSRDSYLKPAEGQRPPPQPDQPRNVMINCRKWPSISKIYKITQMKSKSKNINRLHNCPEKALYSKCQISLDMAPDHDQKNPNEIPREHKGTNERTWLS